MIKAFARLPSSMPAMVGQTVQCLREHAAMLRDRWRQHRTLTEPGPFQPIASTVRIKAPAMSQLIDLFITHQMMIAGRKKPNPALTAAPEPWAGASPYKAERNSLKTTFPAETPCLRAQSLAVAKP